MLLAVSLGVVTCHYSSLCWPWT